MADPLDPFAPVSPLAPNPAPADEAAHDVDPGDAPAIADEPAAIPVSPVDRSGVRLFYTDESDQPDRETPPAEEPLP